MLISKFFRLQDPEDGSGSGPVDRGDTLEPIVPVVATPDPKDVAADPEVKKLEEELKAGEADPAAEHEHDDAKKDQRIPAARHKEILEKERAKTAALAAEVAELKKRGQVEGTREKAATDFDAMDANIAKLEDEYATLLTDGEIKKATAVMAQIRAAERQMADIKADLKVQAATLQANETARYQTVLSRVEAAYPALNPDHEEYNEAVEKRVVRLSRANQVDGMTPAAALQDAVETILGAETTKQKNATTVTPRVDATAERKAAAADKTTKAIAKTPPALNNTGMDSDKAGGGADSAEAIIKLSQSEFAKLSEAALAKARGDEI
jgi:hypothetical protein